jgi:4-amino-4-deoxy-L-arabinose transferase-like glycosyltransferase
MVIAEVGERAGELPRLAVRPLGIVVAVQAVLLLALSGRYGFHRDELYFLAAGKRLAWGYVDQPPLTPLLARVSTAIFGETPTGLRVVSVLVGLLSVLVVALIVRELGGGAAAQLLAAVAAGLSAFVLVVSHLLSTTTVDLLVWTVIGLLAIRLLRTGNGRWWVPIGAAAGVGLANKWLVLALLAGLGISVLVVGPRSVLRTWWLAAGVGAAAMLAAPVLIWQAAHGFPLLTVASGISGDDGAENRILFVPMQFLLLSPVLVPVWVAGLVRLWRDPRLRAVALAYPVMCLLLLALGGKPYYSVPLLIVLLAAGAEPAVRWLRGGRARRTTALTAAAIGTVISLIVSLPVLPAAWLRGPVEAMNKESGEQVGWPGFVDSVSQVWQQVPVEQRATAVILAGNYGEAGAIEYYGPARGLPAPYSGHMSYADWGPPPDSMAGPVLVVGAPTSELTGCVLKAKHDNGIGLDNDEQGTRIWLCGGPAQAWSVIWPRLRRYY